MATLVQRVTKLSHKAFRALLKKFRRKKHRRIIAINQEKLENLERERLEASPGFMLGGTLNSPILRGVPKEREEEKRRNSELYNEFEEKESRRKHREWLLREDLAQAEFQRKKKQQELEKEKREKERLRMLSELEERNLLEANAVEKEKKNKAKKEEALQEALSGLPQGNEAWQNPIAPENYNTVVEKDACMFFAKTGCCRFGDRCSRSHAYPEVSCTLLIRGMYSHFSIEQGNRDDYDTDMGLEFEDREMYQDFRQFYEDVLPEFKTCGRVMQFKVCCNHEPHLRGNVYVQFSREEYAIEAYKKFNGRFYAGKQITCQFSNVTNWKSALCGLFSSKRCPKGNNCNFLHAFKNPTNEFQFADLNWPDLKSDHHSNSRRSSHSSHRSRYIRSSHRHYERSPSHRSARSYADSPPSKRRRKASYSDSSTDEEHSRNTSVERRRSLSRSDSSHSSDERHKKNKKKSKKKKKKKGKKERKRSRTPS